jgi:hypothetical protein
MTTPAASVVQQIGDGNTGGSSLFPAVDYNGNPAKGSFFGGTPVVQPVSNALAALLRGQAAGVAATYGTSQSPSIVNANTSSEKAMTVQTGTGASMLLAATDLCYVNKPTSQAGLGVGNIRVSASNTAQVNMTNWTGVGVTPTGAEVYSIVALRGLPSVSFLWSPAAVAANATAEQQVTIVPAASGANAGIGLAPGTLVQVVKPTSQAGLDIVGCRVVSNNVLGVKFVNVTAAPITPTAAETYLAIALPGLDAINNDVFYGFNVGAVGAIGPGVVATGGSTALLGVLATDVVTGIMKPTAQAAATNAAIPFGAVPTADALTLSFFGVGTGYTPTASEVYGVRTARINPLAPLLLYTPTLTPVAVAANTTAEQTFTITGLIAGTPVWLNYGALTAATPGLGIAGVRVSATNTLAINFTNSTGAAITPPPEAYIVGNFQAKSPGAGNCVYQAVSAGLHQVAGLLAALRTALGPAQLNLHAGA